MKNGWRTLSVLTAALTLATLVPVDADACGGFFRRRQTKTVAVPSLEAEQVLIVHDPATETEHFVREIVFRDAKEPFGFVVPLPSQPTVTKVEKSPFAALAARFPPEPPEPPGRSAAGSGARGMSNDGAARPREVTVLSKERIGSFTVFVLEATNAGALKKWLDDNDLATTPESDAWLQHYVDLGFYYAAFRYEMPAAKTPSPAAKTGAKAETVQITFKTPLPYYPYLEPKHPTPSSNPRVLSVWYMSPQRAVPVAAVKEGSAIAWKRPWAESVKHPDTSLSDLTRLVGAASLGALADPSFDSPDRLVVQTFQDQKRSREGWGDVVLVPNAPLPSDPARAAKLSKLMRALDPSLTAGGGK